MNGNVNPYIFPVSRIGNAKNPKLVILMNNPGRSPENINEMAESRMNFKNPDDSTESYSKNQILKFYQVSVFFID